MKASFFLILVLTTTNLSAQADAEHPVALQSNVLDMTTHGEGGNSYYQFSGGPGDVTISVQASTDYYSSPVELELLNGDGKSFGTVDLVATDTVGRATRTFRFPSRDNVILKVATQSDRHVKWLKYRIALKGALELPAPVVTAPAAATTSSPATATVDPAVATAPSSVATEPPVGAAAEVPTPAPAPAIATGKVSSLATLVQSLASVSSLPSQGTLRIEMKDGTVRLVPLANVLRLNVVQP